METHTTDENMPAEILIPEQEIGNIENIERLTLRDLLIPSSIILGAIIIAVTLFMTRPATTADAVKNANDPGNQPTVNVKDVKTQGEPYIGNANAPMTMAYWSDYQCPFCKQFELTTMPDIIKNYVNSGKLKIVFKDFQFLGPDSDTGALTARAVWTLYPDKYFAWREAMYQNQDKENSGFGDRASILALTKTISGIDATKVFQTVDKNQAAYENAIQADRAEGAQFGIQGTPGYIIGNQLLSGYMTYPDVNKVITSQTK